MADFTLNAPGTTSNPYSPANVLTGLGSSGFLIASNATGIRAATAGNYTEFAHNSAYGSTIVVTATIASGATSNGDEIWLGPAVRSGANIGGGFGVIIGAFSSTLAWWTGASNLGGSTNISTGTSITRANSDIWTLTSVISGGTATLSVLQNGSPISYNINTNTHFTGEASLAAGMAFNPQNNNSLFISQFTGTGVSGGGAVSTLMGGICL